jgi:hypothetical protein
VLKSLAANFNVADRYEQEINQHFVCHSTAKSDAGENRK